MSGDDAVTEEVDVRYRKVDEATWGDARFRALSPVAPSGQALWLFLLTTPLANQLPGVVPHGRAALAEALGWSVEDFDRCWGEVERAGMARADWAARLVWLPNAVRYNRPESPNVVRSWRRSWEATPECPLKGEVRRALGSALNAMGPGFARAWGEVVGDARVARARSAAGSSEVPDESSAGSSEVPARSVEEKRSDSASVSEAFDESRARTRARAGTRSPDPDRSSGSEVERRVYLEGQEPRLYRHLFEECPAWEATRRRLTTERARALDAEALALCRSLCNGVPFVVAEATARARDILGRYS